MQVDMDEQEFEVESDGLSEDCHSSNHAQALASM